ncbi:hypothetical protein ACFWPU_10595 [Streptomyces sp. NPDC058471]|uniref:hypothetical protein n=1 Tax=Streptomyces sp. NPDC058471 TaxID=3346516 RepID=UPI003667B0A0
MTAPVQPAAGQGHPRARHEGQALLHRVDSTSGLTETDLGVLGHWLEGVFAEL